MLQHKKQKGYPYFVFPWEKAKKLSNNQKK